MKFTIPSKKSQLGESAPPLMAISVRDAAKRLSISERTLWKAVKAGAIRSQRIGCRVIIPIDGIHEFLNGTGNNNQNYQSYQEEV